MLINISPTLTSAIELWNAVPVYAILKPADITGTRKSSLCVISTRDIVVWGQ